MGCTAKKWCCCYWSFCCLTTVIIGAALAVIASNFEEPSVEVSDTQLSGMNVTMERIAFHIDITVHVENNNSWPLTGSLESLTAQIWSLDKQAADQNGEAFYLGDGVLLEPVTIATMSATDIEIQAKPEVKASPDNGELFVRMNRDCGPASALPVPIAGGGGGKTKMRIKLTNVVGSAAGIGFDLSGMDIEFETEVPCQ